LGVLGVRLPPDFADAGFAVDFAPGTPSFRAAAAFETNRPVLAVLEALRLPVEASATLM
jgi:hypothetical protein